MSHIRIVFAVLLLVMSSAGVDGRSGAGGASQTPWRDPSYWPFEPRSPWNHPVGSEARYQTETSPVWNPESGGHINTRWNGVKVWYAEPTDPVERVVTTTPHFPVREIMWRMPAGFHGALGGDQHAVVISPDRTEALEVIEAGETPASKRGSDGIWRFFSAHTVSLVASSGWRISPYDTTAAYAANLGGLIRVYELERGIHHALAGVLSPKALNRHAPNGKSWVWPAASSDAPHLYGTTGNVYMGSLLAIPVSVNLARLGIRDPRAMRIARALQDYGVYIRDVGGRGSSIALYGESDLYAVLPPEGTSFWRDLNRALGQLQVVVNNRPESQGGGGRLRRPLAPRFGSP